jgi:hypothetical protein
MVSFAKQLTFSLSRPEVNFSTLAKFDMTKFALAMGKCLPILGNLSAIFTFLLLSISR